MNKILELLGTYKKYVAAIVVFIAWSGGMFAVGRYTVPVKVVETVKVVEITKTETITVEKIVEKKVFIQATNQSIHKEKTEITTPDGTVTKKEIEDTNITQVIQNTETVFKDKIVEKIVEVEKTVEKLKIVEKSNDWRVGAMVGTKIQDVGISLTAPYIQPIVFGGTVERRIIGPLYLGAYGLSNGNVGITASLNF